MTRLLLRAALVAILLSGCERAPEAPAGPTGEFGIFFGGQIQERRDIPFELDRTRQSQGFRVELRAPLPRDVTIEWRIDRPRAGRSVARKGTPPGAPAPADAAEAPPARGTLRAGATRFDQSIPFEPGDPLGVWNVRVIADGKVVIDRPFEVYDESARAKASKDGGR